MSYVLIIMIAGGWLVQDSLINMVRLWVGTDTYMHGALVIPLCFMMIKQMPQPKEYSKPHTYNLITASALWLLALYISNISLFNVLQQFVYLTIFFIWIYAAFGIKGIWHYRTPLILFFLCIPFGDSFVPHLQSITADLAVFLLRLSDVSVYRQGWYLSIPNADFRVAEACSGVNFLISTFVLGVFFSFMEFNSTLKRLIFISLSIAVPILANGARVYLIIIIADMGYVEAATGFDHLVYGWIFFMLVLGVLATVGWFWREKNLTEEKDGSEKSIFKSFSMNPSSKKPMLLLSACAILFVSQLNNNTFEYNQEQLSSTLGAHFPGASSHIIEQTADGTEKHKIYFNQENNEIKLLSINNRLFSTADWTIDSTRVVKHNHGEALETKLKNLHGETKYLYSSYFSKESFYATKKQAFLPLWAHRLRNPAFERGILLVLSNKAISSKEELTSILL